MTKRRTNRPRSQGADISANAMPIGPLWPILLLPVVTLALLSAHCPPLDVWPLGYVSLVPWLAALCTTSRRIWRRLVNYALGVLFFAVNIAWLMQVTPPGYATLVLYLAVYFPLAGWLVRHAYVRRGLRLTIAVPIAWTATEFLRGIGPLAFPWLLLGQSQYRILPMIQVADLGGAYAVTFVVAMVNGLLADLVLDRRRGREGLWPSRRAAVALTAGVLLATLGYGQWRLGQDSASAGPKVAVIQGDYPLSVELISAGGGPTVLDKRRAYFKEALEAAAAEPDLIVMPETPWTMTLNADFRKAADIERNQKGHQSWSKWCHAWFRQLSDPDPTVPVITNSTEHHRRMIALGTDEMRWIACLREDAVLAPAWRAHLAGGHRMSVVVGGFGAERFPTAVYPKEKRYNSAYVYTPGVSEPQRYDKVHLVLFGEYVPFRGGRLHRLYLWLNSLTPWGQDGHEYSLTAGEAFTTFGIDARTEDGTVRKYAFATPICYEDTIPYVCRAYARPKADGGAKGADFFVNISNDGWFNHSAELSQHLAVSVFRAVENRVGIARAVNTGMSGFIDPSGRIRDVIDIGKQGHRVSNVRVDSRITLYTQWGDWFGITCCIVAAGMFVDAVWVSRRRRTELTDKDVSE